MIKKHKGKLLFGCVVALLLVVSFFAGEPLQKTENVLNETQQEMVLGEETTDTSTEQPISFAQPEEEPEKAEETQKPQEETEPAQAALKEEVAQEAPQKAPEESDSAQNVQAPSCTLLVRCNKVFEHLDNLKDGKEAYLPKNGVILKAENVSFSEGESVFDVVRRELKKHGIHFEFTDTPMYDSVYIEGIANLYEFDCGDYSGWMYRVNGVKPTYGCSQYILKDKDNIEFFYSCNLFES